MMFSSSLMTGIWVGEFGLKTLGNGTMNPNGLQPVFSWMTDRCWRFLGFTLKEQEERNTVQSKIKIQEKYKANSLLIWFLGRWHWTNVHKCLILPKEQMVSSTLPNSELEAITVPGSWLRARTRPTQSWPEARMGAVLRGCLGRN